MRSSAATACDVISHSHDAQQNRSMGLQSTERLDATASCYLIPIRVCMLKSHCLLSILRSISLYRWVFSSPNVLQLIYVKHDLQKRWLSPTERASVFAIILRHILASPAGVRPWDNRGKCHMSCSCCCACLICNCLTFCEQKWMNEWMDGWMKKRIQCLSNILQHVPIYLQPFPSNSTRKFKSSPF